MKHITTNFIATLLAIIIFFIGLIVIFAVSPLCFIAFPFVFLLTRLLGDDDDDYN